MQGYGKYAVYILASRKYGSLYIEWLKGFTSRYHIHHLVYAEFHTDPSSAIQRKKQLKKWRREWKIELIEQFNPDWRDLFDEIAG